MYNSKIDKINSSLDDETLFYEGIDQKNKKIFLLGHSHIISQNTTFIQDYLSSQGKNYTVYNLAIGSSEPKDRVRTIDLLISAKPDIVVYGISERDFRSTIPLNVDDTKLPRLLPDVRLFFEEQIWKLGLQKLNFLENPKFTTLVSIYDFSLNFWKNDNVATTSNGIEEFSAYPNMPFYKITPGDTPIFTDQELFEYVLKTRVGNFREINLPHANVDVFALKEIISKLQQNNIKTIVFTTPHHKSYLSITPPSVSANFNIIVKDLEKESNIRIYPFLKNYTELNIWNDPTHVAVNDQSLIYSEDIAKIIISELES